MASISPSTLSNGKEPYTGKNAYVKLTITSISQTGGATNQTTVNWKLTVEGTPYVYLYALYVTLGGVTLYDHRKSGAILTSWSAGDTIASGSTTFNNNSDGSLTLYAYIKQMFYYGYSSARWGDSYYYQEAGTNMVCSTIPRYATSNQSLNSKTETSIKMNWSSDSTVDYLWYSKDNGSSWTGVDVSDGTSGTYTISGLSANTTYNIKTRVRRKDSQLTTDSSSLSVTTYNYPYCTSSPNFTIGNAVKLDFYNPLNRTISVKLIGNGDATLGTWSGTGTTIAGFNDSGSVAGQYASIPDNTSSTYKVQVTYGSVVKTRNNGNTYSIKGTETPTFSTFTYKDSNTTVTDITGNDQVLVKGLSTLQVTIASANKMIAQNSATAKNYVMSIDTLTKTVDYSTSDITASVGTVTSSGTKRLNVRAYDSRTLSTLAYKDITVYDYAKPVINASITRLNNFENQTTIKVSGTYTRLTIDGTDKNTITNVQYRYRETGGTWSSWTTLSTTITSGKFTCSDVILSLDNTKSFEFQIQAVDKLQTNTSTKTLDVGQAIFFISSNNKACYINGQEIIMYDVVDEW